MSGRHREPGRRRAKPQARPPGPPLSRSLPSGLAVLALVAALSGGVLWWHHRGVARDERARSSAVAAARAAVADLLSYDYRSIDAGVRRAQARTTGAFAKQYADTASQLLTEAKQVQAIVQASVGSAGVVDSDAHDVVVPLFVDQASVKQLPGQKSPVTRIDQSRVRVTMTRTHGRWLVSALSAL